MAQQLRRELFTMLLGRDDDARITAANSFMKKARYRVEQKRIRLVKLYGMPTGASRSCLRKRSHREQLIR